MKKLIRALPLLAVATFASLAAPKAHAQLVTFETLSSYNGSGIIGFVNGNTALTQTFTNVLELQSVTYRFTTVGTDSVSQNISAYLVQWDTTNLNPLTTFTAPTIGGNAASDATTTQSLTPFQTFTIPPAGTGAWQLDNFPAANGGGTYNGYDVSLSVNQFTDPSLTYAIVLIDTTSASGLGLEDVNLANPGDAFPFGKGYQLQGNSTLAAYQADPGDSSTIGSSRADYGFAQIVVVPNGNTIPMPEPRTAAAILCALFVAGLIGRQMLLRRQEDAAPGAILAA